MCIWNASWIFSLFHGNHSLWAGENRHLVSGMNEQRIFLKILKSVKIYLYRQKMEGKLHFLKDIKN